MLESREEGKACLVQTKDSIYESTSLKEVKINDSKNGYFVLDNGVSIKSKDVIAYQNKRGYFFCISDYYPVKFAHRTEKGNICYYSVSFQDPRGARVDQFHTETKHLRYLQKKGTLALYDFGYDNMKWMVGDYKPSLDLLEKYAQASRFKKDDMLLWNAMVEYNKAVKEGRTK